MSLHAEALSPEQCRLLVCLPTSEAEFYLDASAPGKDFARGVIAQLAALGKQPQEMWTEYERQVLQPWRVAVKLLDKLQVPLRCPAPLSALTEATRRGRAVVIVAHHREPAFSAAELPQPERLYEHSERSTQVACLRLRQLLLRQQGKPEHEVPERADATTTAQWLNAAVTASQARPSASPGAALHPLDTFRLTRSLLEEALGPDIVAEGAALEFADGLKTVRQLAQALPADWHGELDLALCHSFAFADVLKRLRPNILVARHSTALSPRFVFMRLVKTLELLQRRWDWLNQGAPGQSEAGVAEAVSYGAAQQIAHEQVKDWIAGRSRPTNDEQA